MLYGGVKRGSIGAVIPFVLLYRQVYCTFVTKSTKSFFAMKVALKLLHSFVGGYAPRALASAKRRSPSVIHGFPLTIHFAIF